MTADLLLMLVGYTHFTSNSVHMSKRFVPTLLLCAATSGMFGCTNFTNLPDTSGALYARISGTVKRADGTAVANATIGMSCLGKKAEPFGQTTQANAAGEFEIPITTPWGFEPLDGLTSVCRVLTPMEGTAQAEKSVTVTYSTTSASRPTTQVELVIP